MAESRTRQGRQDRKDHERACSELAALLKQHQDQIATAWAEMVQGLRGTFWRDLPTEEVHHLTLRGLKAMADSLESGSESVLEDYLAEICAASSDAVADMPSLVEAVMLCRDAATPLVREAFGPDSNRPWVLISELDTLLCLMVRRLASTCTADMAEQLGHERAQVTMLLDMAQTVTSTLELAEVVSRVSEAIAAALGVDRCTFYLVDEEQRSAVHVRQPSDWSSRTSRPFQELSGLFHEVLTRREPVTVYDGMRDPRVPSDYVYRDPETKSGVVVPLLVKGKVVAMAGAYTVDDYRGFNDEEIALAQGIGNMLGLVIRDAQLYEQSKLLTVMEERARLSREIHDGIAQTLGALQLKASQLEDSLCSQRIGESQGHLTQLQEMISRAYRDLREAMLGLRAVVEPGTDLVTGLREYVTHYEVQCGVGVRVEASEDEQATLDGETQAQAMRIVQEALSNVHRHAGTNRARVCIERVEDHLRICVVDEGRGFDLGLVEGCNDGLHLGLCTMRERAESVGGDLIVESEPGQGTKVVLQLPLPGDGGSA
jgi:signal transduction histidine kinase